MYTLVLCLFIACLLPYFSKIPLALEMHKKGGYDNHNPRHQQAILEGFGARTLGAHLNSFEALIIFTAAITTALATHHYELSMQYMALGFIVLRVIYNVCYWLDYAMLRSTVWFFSMLCSLGILFGCLP